MFQEPFARGTSVIHELDPRSKVVVGVSYAFFVALSTRFLTLTGALIISFVLIGLARLNPGAVAKRAMVVNGLILFFWVVLPITFEGEALFDIGPFPVTRPGILLSARITLKSNAIFFTFMALVESMSAVTLGHTLNRLRVPEKVVHLFLMTYRYVFVVEEEFSRLLRAAKIRGFRPKTTFHTYKTYAYLLGMLLVRASVRAERVQQAMACRGFRGKFYCLADFSWSRRDWLWCALMTGLMIVLVLLEGTTRV